jgi:hypothetical protein
MTDPQSAGPLGLPSTVWIALILSVVGLFALTQKPFEDARPPNPTLPLGQSQLGDEQNVEARLWEDPFSAVAVAIKSHARQANGETLKAKVAPRTLLLGVVVTGAPYNEDVEVRRRARYAVLGGLYRSGFIPVNGNHIGYVQLGSASKTPEAASAPLRCTVVNGPESGSSASIHRHDVAAFEWFQPDEAPRMSTGGVVVSAQPTPGRVLVLWLDREGLRDRPMQCLSVLFDSIADRGTETQPIVAAVLGPSDSDGLRELYEESKQKPPGDLRRMWFYSSRATASDASILNMAEDHPRHELARRLSDYSDKHVHFFRVVADDKRVAEAVLKELGRRGIDDPAEIALVAERDTLYARRMGSYFGGCGNAADNHVRCYTYLRGLDGLTAVAAGASIAASESASSAKSAEDSSKDGGVAPTASDAATGAGQLDYLRRLADLIAAQQGRHRIRAIGVISSDVYDKLLVLQALRSALPSVTYFTFDLDAQLTDPRSLKTTRHLIVGSSLGLSLFEHAQGDIPPFRDTYQTSTFFATQLAVRRFGRSHAIDICDAPRQPRGFTPVSLSAGDTRHTAQAPEPDGEDLATDQPGLQWIDTPRIFQIGRTQAFDLMSPGDHKDCYPALDRCHSIALGGRNAFWNRPTAAPKRLIAALAAVGLGLCAVVVAFGLRVMTGKSRTHTIPFLDKKIRWSNGVAFGLLALILFATMYTLWPSIANRITDHGARIPAPLFSGANYWTSSLIEVLVIATVVVLVLRGQRKLNDNAEWMRREFGFAKNVRELISWHKRRLAEVGRRRIRIVNLLWFRFRPLARHSGVALADDQVSPLEALIAQYLHRGTVTARLLRVVTGTIVALALLVVLEAIPLVSVFHRFSAFTAYLTHQWLADLIPMMSLFAMLFLVLWSADALLLSRSFLLAMMRDNPDWPHVPLRKECTSTGMSEEQAVLWLNLRLIARRTSSVANLIWYPSFVIAAMGIARLTIQFGEFQFANNPAGLLLGTLFVVGSAIALRSSSEALRSRVIHRLEDKRLNERAARGRGRSQADVLVRRVKALREGAFAPYSEQPIVRAVLVPALTYGATISLQYLQLSH